MEAPLSEVCPRDLGSLQNFDFVLDTCRKPPAFLDMGSPLELEVDFSSHSIQHRLKTLNRREPLVKALAKLPKDQLIFDLTAGLGLDALGMSHFGFQVLAFEKNPLVFFLLQQALKNHRPPGGKLHFCLYWRDSLEVLKNLKSFGRKPDIVYLDPMFPEKPKKRALSGKNMQVFRRFVGPDSHGRELLEQALKVAKNRVLVKRPRRASPLLESPNCVYRGNLSRIDMYLARR